MMSPLMIPLMIAGGVDGVEPYEPVKYEVVAPDGHLVGVREIARLTGYSPAHVCYTRRGLRISRPLRAKMRELGLTFEPATLRARHSLRSARLLPHGSQAPSRGGYALKRQGKGGK